MWDNYWFYGILAPTCRDFAVAAGVIFLTSLVTEVNIAAITLQRVYTNLLSYWFKTPFFPLIPTVRIFMKLELAFYLLLHDRLAGE